MDTAARTASPWRLALAVAAPVLGLVLAGLMVAHDPTSRDPFGVLAVAIAIVVPGTVGFLVVRRHPRHVIGWLLVCHAFFIGVGMSTPPGQSEALAVRVLTQLSAGWWVLLYICLVAIGYLFPTGRPRNRRWARWFALCLAGYAMFIIGATDDRGTFHQFYPGQALPLRVPFPAVLDVVGAIGLVLVAASLVGTVVCARLRLRDATGDERLQLLWFSWAALTIPTILACCWLDHAITGGAGLITVYAICLLGSVIPVAIGIAILRTRLFDIELVLSRTLTYGVLTVGVVGLYALIVGTAQAIAGTGRVAGAVAVVLVAVLVQPVHSRVRRAVERRVYGDRNDAATALRRLADNVEGAVDPIEVVEGVTDAVTDALRVDRAWVEREREADVGDEHTVRVPLVHRGERLGDLAVQVPPGRALSATDVALLHDLARYAAVVVQAAGLAADLQASRARLVTAREEERRRLRRDLHDGLGPSLAAIVLKLNAAQSRDDARSRDELLAQTLAEASGAIAEVRRLVDDLRPPAIDEVGLVGAIRQRAASLGQGSPVDIEVGGPAALPPLAAAVEVAAFRIAAEAMTNVVRHAHATRCRVHLAVNGAFELTVSDNGHGARPGTGSGVGWTSMAERAAELGGTCTVSSRAGGGLVVRAVLPLSDLDSAADVAVPG